MIGLFRRAYGSSPLHLLGQLVAFAIAAYAVVKVVDVRSTDNFSLVLWFVAGALLHDLIFVPIYLVLDLVTRLGIQDNALRRVRAINYIRFPVAISGVMFLTTFPLILGKSQGTYARVAGEQTPDYLARWLLVTAIVFAGAALAYAVAMRPRRSADVADADAPPASVRA